MIELIKLQWEFFRQPTLCLEKYIRNWPLRFGFCLYVYYLFSNELMNTEQLRLRMDIFAFYSEDSYIGRVFAWIILTALMALLFTWHLIPLIIRWLLKKSKDEFNSDLYRKLVFYSPIAFIIFSTIFVLPVKIAVLIFARIGMEGTAEVVLLALLVLLEKTLFLWATILVFSSIVVVWKGLKRYFELNTWQIILTQFLVPSIVFVPLFLLRFPNIWNFIRDYATAR